VDDGGRVVIRQDVAALATRFETRLLVLERPGEPRAAIPDEYERWGVDVAYAEHRFPVAPVALLAGALGRWPYTLARYQSRAFADAVRTHVHHWRPDLAFLNNLHLAPYASAVGNSVRVLRQQNLEQLWLARYADSVRNPAVKAYAAFQARRMRDAEARLCGEMDLVLAMHEDEARAMRAFAPGVRVEAVPVAADFDDATRRAPAAEPTLLVVGSWDRDANAQGARAFLEQGWPAVRARVPGARLRLVGRGIPTALADLARSAGAEPVGYVADLAGELARAWGLVVPLWYGAGARVKTVEAVAARVPVACTPLGVEGLGFVAGRHFLEAATAAGLGEAAAALLERPDEATRRAEEAHAFARERYGRAEVARRTVALCEAALAGPRRADPGAGRASLDPAPRRA
jgi:glycosyltransferase involved in cell wall biosynthesis